MNYCWNYPPRPTAWLHSGVHGAVVVVLLTSSTVRRGCISCAGVGALEVGRAIASSMMQECAIDPTDIPKDLEEVGYAIRILRKNGNASTCRRSQRVFRKRVLVIDEARGVRSSRRRTSPTRPARVLLQAVL